MSDLSQTDNIIAIIQARMSSTRLPGKVLKTICQKPMLELLIERLALSKQIDQIVVATSCEAEDDVIEQFCQAKGFLCYRGSLTDVLDRYVKAARQAHAKHVVRITADCPLIDAHIVDDVIKSHLQGGYDYTSNAIEPTFPDGLDVEVMTIEALELSWQQAVMNSEREHVTQYILDNPKRFNLKSYQTNDDQSHLRLTVDEPQDFQVVQSIFESLYPQNVHFTLKDMLQYLKSNPELLAINQHFKRNEGFYQALESDFEVVKGASHD